MSAEEKLDSFQVGLFKDQLLRIEDELLQVEYEQLYWANGSLIPIEVLNDEISEEVAVRQTTAIGSWELWRDYTTTVPNVDLVSREFRQPVEEYVGGYSISDREILAFMVQGRSLDTEKMQAVVDTGNQKLDDLIFYGSSKLKGFLLHPDTLKSTSPFRFNSTSTANQIISVLAESENLIVRITKNVEVPDTLLISKRAFDYINYARIDSVNDTSILEYYLSKSAYIRDVMPLIPLDGKGEDGTDCMCFYRRDPSRIRARVMSEIAFKKFIEQPWGFQRTANMRYGGLRIARPFSILWVSGL